MPVRITALYRPRLTEAPADPLMSVVRRTADRLASSWAPDQHEQERLLAILRGRAEAPQPAEVEAGTTDGADADTAATAGAGPTDGPEADTMARSEAGTTDGGEAP
ncbi:hypothetical protein [Streptomyces sp. TS71-3]|uniref:hypothetical protein n=1 Tax=Streptomyces sp. TS71-3 TaxID=2733862 RepID=UPI001B28AA9F|nr:hypothetical protein [Streptomyces sp. TS71-3]GHJ36795.1 hypothetical protein Sm713_24040 [Streptomyces sp. TS71-3]